MKKQRRVMAFKMEQEGGGTKSVRIDGESLVGQDPMRMSMELKLDEVMVELGQKETLAEALEASQQLPLLIGQEASPVEQTLPIMSASPVAVFAEEPLGPKQQKYFNWMNQRDATRAYGMGVGETNELMKLQGSAEAQARSAEAQARTACHQSPALAPTAGGTASWAPVERGEVKTVALDRQVGAALGSHTHRAVPRATATATARVTSSKERIRHHSHQIRTMVASEQRAKHPSHEELSLVAPALDFDEEAPLSHMMRVRGGKGRLWRVALLALCGLGLAGLIWIQYLP